MADLPKLRAVIFQEGPWWVAMFLEYYFATMATSLEKLPPEVERILTVQVLASAEHGVEPFDGFKPAPPRFWRMYEQATPLASPGNTELRLFAGDPTGETRREKPSPPDARQEP